MPVFIRRTLKILHGLDSIGLMGAVLAWLVLLGSSDLHGQAVVELRTQILRLGGLLLLPSMVRPLGAACDRSSRGAAATLGRPERGILWLLLASSVLNVVLGVWRPRLSRRADPVLRNRPSAAGPSAPS